MNKIAIWRAGFIILLTFLFAASAYAAGSSTDQANTDFDHLSTGFFLSPVHQTVECADCHVKGVFKGTPTRCDSCHSSSSVITALGKNPGHINSSGDCEECHGENGLNWSEINFKTHDAVIGDCSGCHNDRIALGKPKNHIPSNDQCEDCHSNTSTYTVGVFDHSGTTSNCVSCHDGNHAGTPTASAQHMQSTTTCESCHNALTKEWTTIVNVDHNDVIQGTCNDCHSASNAIGPTKSNQHIPSIDECDSCHNTSNFLGATFDHSGTTTNCVSCHDGNHSGTPTASAQHMQSTTTCESCHNALTKDWAAIIKVDHSDVIQGTCDDCHSTSNAIGPIKSNQHIVSHNECDSCHNTVDFFGATFDHDGTTTNCFACHDGNHSGAPTKSGRHMQSSSICESCHNALTRDWTGIVSVDHGDVIQGTCDDCHSTVNAIGPTKSNQHIPSNDECDSCHNTVNFLGISFDHSGTTTNCFACHDGNHSGAPTKSGRHMQSSSTCESCHNALTKDWAAIVNVDHGDVIQGTCDDCHSAANAIGPTKSNQHIPSNDECDSCHNTVNFLGISFDHNGTTTNCFACHDGNHSGAPTKSGRHMQSSSTCESCHNALTKDWTAIVNVDHGDVVQGTCDDCHSAANAIGPTKSNQHIPSNDECDSCHNTVNFLGISFDHSGTTTNCFACHDGNHSGAPTKSGRHMQSSSTCESCHNALTKDWTAIVNVDHGDVIQGTCDDCHSAANAIGPTKSNQHIPSNDECDSCHNTVNFLGISFDHSGTTTNCFACHDGNHSGAPTKSGRHMQSSSTCESCHNALTRDWTAIVNVDHGDVVQGTCDDCHSAANAIGPTKSNQHIPSNDECDSCHNTVNFLGISFDHSGTTTNCFACHDGNHSGAPTKSGRHMQSSSTCENCHNALTKDWTAIVNVDHGDVIQGTCDDCHSAANAIGPIKSNLHIPSNDECDSCHNTVDFLGTTFDHNGTTTNCFGCHDGNHSGAPAMSRRHMTSSNTCESCHNALTKDWYSIIGVDHSDVIQGTCDDCHSASNAIGPTKSNQHIPSNNECDSCHNTVNFLGTTFDHNGTTTNCFGCHDGNHSGASAMSRRHMTSSNTCESCHNALTKDWYSIIGVDHSDVIQGTCSECHTGQSAISTTKPNTHISSSNTCDNCHFNAGVGWLGALDQENSQPDSVTVTNGAEIALAKKVTVKPESNKLEGAEASTEHDEAPFIHPTDSENCAACHNDSLAKGQPIKHMNTLKSCDDCHGVNGWTPIIRVDHAATIGTCFSCHNRRTAEGKPTNHISSDNNCDNCHVTQLWSQVVMDHSNVTGSCSICHDGRSAPAKPIHHIASNNTCNDCHRRRTWTPVYRVDHLAVSGNCFSCHNGRMAEGKVANHPSTHNNCEECHRNNLWSLVTVNHNNLTGTCLSCHLGDYKQRYHKKTQQANPVYYNANELVDCAGSCHVYEDQSFSTISIRRPGPDHRPFRGAW